MLTIMFTCYGERTRTDATGNTKSEEQHSIDSTERMITRNSEGEVHLGSIVSCEVTRLVLKRMGSDITEERMRSIRLQL